MDQFSIDDVRESFAADMSAKIRRVFDAGHALLVSDSLGTPVAVDPVDRIPGFDAVSQACHAIFGTSALVSARSMAESARLLEILANVGKDALAEIERNARIGRSLGEACVEGAQALGRMLELELDHRGEEAWEVALQFRERMGRWEEARDAIAQGEPPREFAFDEEGPASVRGPLVLGPEEFSFEERAAPEPPPPSLRAEAAEFSFDEEAGLPREPDDALSLELLEVFRQEAREGLVQLEARLRAVAANARDRDALAALETLFHTLKGSAATVGLARVAAMASDLQDTIQDALDRDLESGAPFGPGALQDAVTRTNSLLAAADLPAIDPWSEPADEAAETSRDLEPTRPALPPEAPPAIVAAGGPTREAVTITVPPELWDAFEEETSELVTSADKQVLALEESTQPQVVLSELFRLYHTMKGSMHTVGLGPLARTIHRLEDFLEEMSGAPILPPLRLVATLLLNVQDDVKRGLREAREGSVETRLPEIEAEIAAMRSGGSESGMRVRAADSAGGAPRSSGAPVTSGRRTASGPSSASPRRRFTDRVDTDRRSVRVSTERLDGLMNLTGELVVSRSRLLRRVTRLRSMQRQISAGHQRLTTAVERFRDRHEFSVATTAPTAIGSSASAAARAPSGAWAGFGELEMDQYGDVNILARSLGAIADEVATVQAQVQDALGLLADDTAAFGAIVSSLQGEITRARMVPVEDLFSRLRLPVRDAAQREGKSVRVATTGEDVDLDKTIVDKLYVPLLHVVRNAVSHGIEPFDRRAQAGKDPVGTIALAARQESGLIVLEVADDGAGLDLARLLEAAVKQGALPPDTPLDHPSVADAVFLPGVSTRGGAGEVSGRGVGGDVVRREIEKLGGDIRVKTAAGKGTAFLITLPLTLAITRALLLRDGGQTFAVPLAFAERLLDLSDLPIVDSAGVRRVRLEDGYHPIHDLASVLGRAAAAPAGRPSQMAVLLRAGDKRLAVAVDSLLGQEEIVVKSVGELLTGHPLLSGVTVSGDGELILILDVPGLLDPGRGTSGAATGSAERLPTGPPRILFVDDSLSVRKVAEKLLSELGADVTLAVDGQDALDLLSRQAFDLVFTDLEMPRLHGFELIQAISASPNLRHIPVVVVSSRSGQKHRDEATAVGARDYVTKPFNQEVFAQMLRRWAPQRGRA